MDKQELPQILQTLMVVIMLGKLLQQQQMNIIG